MGNTLKHRPFGKSELHKVEHVDPKLHAEMVEFNATRGVQSDADSVKDFERLLRKWREATGTGKGHVNREAKNRSKGMRQAREFILGKKCAEFGNVEYGPEISDGVDEADYAAWAAQQ